MPGIIEAEQTERDGKTVHNDRIIAASLLSQSLAEVNLQDTTYKYLVDEVIAFFISYNEIANYIFKPLGVRGAKAGVDSIRAQILK